MEEIQPRFDSACRHHCRVPLAETNVLTNLKFRLKYAIFLLQRVGFTPTGRESRRIEYIYLRRDCI